MRIINPSEISGKIMNLFDEAEKFVTVVSPYYNFSKWKKLNKRLETSRSKGIEIKFFVRANEYNSIQEVKNIGYNPTEIENLHAKIYFNENEAIITSMNLNESSDANSLDIGLQTETKEEYADIISFYKKFIASKEKQNEKIINSNPDDWAEKIATGVMSFLSKTPQVHLSRNLLRINGNNVYEAFIAYEKSNLLRINCVLSSKEFKFINTNTNLFKEGAMTIEIQEGKHGYYDLIWGTLPNIKSEEISQLLPEEKDMISNCITGFVIGVEKAKKLATAT